jgi:hypothetical protein
LSIATTFRSGKGGGDARYWTLDAGSAVLD